MKTTVKIAIGICIGIGLSISALVLAYNAAGGLGKTTGGGGSSTAYLDTLYCRLTGCTLSGSLVVGTGQISNTMGAALVPTGTTQTVNWAQGTIQTLDLGSATGAVTLTFTNPASGGSYVLKVIQGATPRTLVQPATVKWADNDALVPSTTNDAIDAMFCIYDGSNYLCNFALNYL